MNQLKLNGSTLHSVVVELPSVELVERNQISRLPAGRIVIQGETNDDVHVATNALELLDVLYGHGIVSCDLLRFLLRGLGHQEQKNRFAQQSPTSESPTVSSTSALVGRPE